MPLVYLFRHAHVDYTPPNPITAHVPLTPAGLEMADLLAQRCDEFALQHLFSSPLLRARQTGDAISARFPDLPRTELYGLAETNYADLEGFEGELPAEDMYSWKEHHFEYSTPRLIKRVLAAWDLILDTIAQQELERVAIVSHGGPMNVLLQSFVGSPLDRDNLFRFNLDWATTCCLSYEGARKVVHWVNDARHIDPLRARLEDS